MYGQFCMIHKETDTVLAMTAVTGDMQGEMNVYYEEVLLHYPNQPLADFLDLTLSCENDIITLTDAIWQAEQSGKKLAARSIALLCTPRKIR